MEPPSTEHENCPVCGTVRTLDRVQCRCGYSFASGFVEPLELADTGPLGRSLGPVSLGRSGERVADEAGGSLFLGALLGFLCGCVGLFLVYHLKGRSETKRGVWIGFVLGGISGVLAELSRQLAAR